ncbi:DNA-binding MarR family transcriptional regulator [Psychromicrobium silvestre]|uniref:DNA-binding MarR family transcriptional regulator n=1 Tax=Psychromicrobium silvestre TaxID=1645614 RepID=A0A7Y9LRA6_9MICC|nr:MarR family transcriptional regulator [Psychromicrobium silvestre]NYE94154.1 DNA-binding MarR family transcriptional regulator [Psychromicrobium silvestre]
MAVEDQTLVELVSEVFRLFRALKSASHEPSIDGLGIAHIGIIGLLSQSGECRATGLAEVMGIGPSALSRQLAELDERGYVIRRPDPEDGRATLIEVSEKGTELLGKVMARRSERLRAQLSDWEEADAREALIAVSRLTDALHASSKG